MHVFYDEREGERESKLHHPSLFVNVERARRKQDSKNACTILKIPLWRRRVRCVLYSDALKHSQQQVVRTNSWSPLEKSAKIQTRASKLDDLPPPCR